MLRTLLLFLATLFFTASVQAATCPNSETCFFVTENGSGLKDGSSWSNSFAGLPFSGTHRYETALRVANLTRGATYYIADGTYPGYYFTNAGGGTKYITIKKATIADHGIAAGVTDPGWNNAMGDGEAVFQSSGAAIWLFAPSTHYYHFNGQVGSGKSPGGYGFRLYSTASRAGSPKMVIIDTSGTYADVGDVTNIILEHIEFDWNNGTSAGPCTANSVIEVRGARPNGYWTIANNYFHHAAGGAIYLRYTGLGHFTIHNNYVQLMGDETNSGACPGASDHAHWETFWFTGIDDLVFSNNTLEDAYPAGLTGWVMLGGVSNAKIYNNLFFCSNPSRCSPGGNGIIAAWSADTNQNISIYHNTFVDLFNGGHFLFEKGSGFYASNNLYVNPQFNCSIQTQSHEACGGGQGCCGTNQQTGVTTAIFKNYTADDFRLAQNTQPGIPLAAPYDLDKNGRIRTTWSRGAYEFESTQSGTPPGAPMNLRVE